MGKVSPVGENSLDSGILGSGREAAMDVLALPHFSVEEIADEARFPGIYGGTSVLCDVQHPDRGCESAIVI